MNILLWNSISKILHVMFCCSMLKHWRWPGHRKDVWFARLFWQVLGFSVLLMGFSSVLHLFVIIALKKEKKRKAIETAFFAQRWRSLMSRLLAWKFYYCIWWLISLLFVICLMGADCRFFAPFFTINWIQNDKHFGSFQCMMMNLRNVLNNYVVRSSLHITHLLSGSMNEWWLPCLCNLDI